MAAAEPGLAGVAANTETGVVLGCAAVGFDVVVSWCNAIGNVVGIKSGEDTLGSIPFDG